MRIRRAERADVDLVAPLFDEYRMFYGQSSDPERAATFVRERIERSESVILVALQADGAAGFVQLYPSFSSVRAAAILVLNDLYVRAGCRRQGAAMALLASALDCARDARAVHMSLTTGVRNLAAQSLYDCAGWTRDENFLTFGIDVEIGHGQGSG